MEQFDLDLADAKEFSAIDMCIAMRERINAIDALLAQARAIAVEVEQAYQEWLEV